MKEKKGMAFGLVTLLLALLFPMSQASWAVDIDTFNRDQAELQITVDDPIGTTINNKASGAGIIGGTRFIELTLTSGDPGESVITKVFGGDFSNSNDTTASSDVRIVWSGAGGNPGDFALGANLCSATKFILTIEFDDLPVDVDLEVYTDASNWSSATLNLPGAIFIATDFEKPFTDFVVQAGTGADFCNVGEIRLVWSGSDALDFSIDQLNAPDELVEMQCDYKTFDGQSLLVLPVGTTCPGDPACTLTAEVSITNSSPALPLTLKIVDTLDDGLTYQSGTTTVIGEPAVDLGPPETLTWENIVIPADTTIVFQYELLVDSISPGETKENHVVVTAPDLPSIPPSTCSAKVTLRPSPPVIPSLSGWGLVIAFVLLAMLGLHLLRRQGRTTA